MAELPGAVPQPWIVKAGATPAGTVEKSKIKSELLKNERDLSIYTPPNSGGKTEDHRIPGTLRADASKDQQSHTLPLPQGYTMLDCSSAGEKIDV